MLVLASGVTAGATTGDFAAITVGYVIMRVAMVAQWVWAGRADPAGRTVAYRYAIGISVLQVVWVLRLFVPHRWGDLSFYVLATAEVLVPVWAQRGSRPSPWHPEHISERYGLFTLIVLGECVAAATVAVRSALSADGLSAGLVGIAADGLLLVFGLWWWCFDHPADEALRLNPQVALLWGYAHSAVSASIAGLGAALEIAVDATSTGSDAAVTLAAVTVAIAVSVFLAIAAALHTWLSPTLAVPLPAVVVAIAAVSASAATGRWLNLGASVTAMGRVVAMLVAADVVHRHRAAAPGVKEAAAG